MVTTETDIATLEEESVRTAASTHLRVSASHPRALVVLNCSQLVTLASSVKGARMGAAMNNLSMIADGAMLVRDGCIEKVGTRGEIEPLIEASSEVVDAGGRVVMPGFIDAHDIPEEYRARREDYVALIVEEMLPRVVEENLAEYADVFCEERVFTVEESRRILTAARALGLGLRVHADQLTLSGGAQLAAELKAVTADHLEHTNTDGIAALKSANVQPVL